MTTITSKNHRKPRKNPVVGGFSINQPPLINPKNVLPPSLHIKLGLMKTLVKAMNHDNSTFVNSKRNLDLTKVKPN